MTTSRRISLSFAGYVAVVVVLFGLLVNIVFFVSRYGLISYQKPLSTEISQQQDTKVPRIQELQLTKRFRRRPFLSMTDSLVIRDPELIQTLHWYQHIFDLVEYQWQIWHYHIESDYVVLTLVDPLIDSQLMLIYATIWITLFIALVSYLVSVVIVHRGLRPLYHLVQHIHSTTDPSKYHHLVVWSDNDELQQVSNALTQAMDDVSRNNQNLKEFVTHASHELKTPLMVISSSIDVLVKSWWQSSHIQTIKQTTQSMKTLIDRLLLTMRGDMLSCVDVDIVPYIQSTIDSIHTFYDDRGLQVVYEMPQFLILCVDVMLLQSVVSNLVDNAHKYAQADTSIIVQLDKQGLRITNTIDDDMSIDMNLIRQPFYKADLARTDGTSHWLWLTIVKKMVERAWWSIDVQLHNNIIVFSVSWW